MEDLGLTFLNFITYMQLRQSGKEEKDDRPEVVRDYRTQSINI
jgi:hypothetical protein